MLTLTYETLPPRLVRHRRQITSTVCTVAGLEEARDKLTQEYPDQAASMAREFRKAIERLREGQ